MEFRTALNPDCSVLEFTNSEIVLKPLHGTFDFAPVTQFAVFPASNPRSKCNDRAVAGTAIFYTADSKFTGIDTFVGGTIDSHGERYTLPITVTVQ